MPTTRSQTQEVTQKKSRGLRKRVRVVLDCDTDTLNFDFSGTKQAEGEREVRKGSTGESAVDVVVSSGKGTQVDNGDGKVDDILSSCARTRPFERLEKRMEATDKEIGGSEDDVQIIEENIKGGSRVVKTSSIAKKTMWISHDDEDAPPASSPTLEHQDVKSKSSQESNGNEDGIKLGIIPGSKPTTILDLSKVPRYLLNPNAFESNPLMKERILKSIYDRERRDTDLKAKLGALKQENLYLRRMLMLAMNKEACPGDGVCISPPPGPSPVNMISPTESIFNASVPLQLGSLCQPKPTSASQEKLQLPSNTVIQFPVPLPSEPKRRRQASSQPRQPRKKASKVKHAKNEEDLLANLYNQFDSETEEDMDSILAAIYGTNVSSSSPSSTASGSEVDVTGERNKRKQNLTPRNAECNGEHNQQMEDDDEVQIIEVIENSRSHQHGLQL